MRSAAWLIVGAGGLAAANCSSKGNASAATTGAGTTSTNTSTSMSAAGGAGGAMTAASSSSGSGGAMPGKRPFPDTTASIAILADQLPVLSAAQQKFAVAHYVGTQKLTLALSQPLRALKPEFLVLHYHLAIWQSAPNVQFIVDGKTWGNDYPQVNAHEPWFWHNTGGKRVASVNDGKLLMNLGDAEFRKYWIDSFVAQCAAGDYDGVFADSASPALLSFEAQSPPEPRLAGTGPKDTPIAELGGKTYIQAWQAWAAELDAALAAKGCPLIPNTGPFITSWDNSDYSLTAGIFAEGFSDPSFAESDWKAATNEILSLVAKDKIVILQNYLDNPNDLVKRRYFLANYLLVKGKHTYFDAFFASPLEWYPEWKLDLGAPKTAAKTVADLATAGVYRRDFAKGAVLVNPTAAPVTVPLGATFQRVVPQGGGPVDAAGTEPGTITTAPVTSLQIPAKGAEILLP